jgi:hypothetical protein
MKSSGIGYGKPSKRYGKVRWIRSRLRRSSVRDRHEELQMVMVTFDSDF